MTVTALIPVYKDPKKASSIIRRLADEARPGARILLVVDGETNPSIEAAIKEAGEPGGVTVITGRPHLGKAEALNRAVQESGGDILLFLDNDIELGPGTGLLARTEAVLADRDIAELPKVGRGRGFVAAMCGYEFLSNVMATDYLVGRTGRMPSMNGAAFAIRRDLFEKLGGFRPTINEDTDLAARAFLSGARFGYDPSMTVGNAAPESARDWLRQRKRWSINAALWSAAYIGKVMEQAPELRIRMGISGAIFPLPFLALTAGALLSGIIAGQAGAAPLPTGFAALAGAALAFSPVAAAFARSARRHGASFGLPGFLAYSLSLPAPLGNHLPRRDHQGSLWTHTAGDRLEARDASAEGMALSEASLEGRLRKSLERERKRQALRKGRAYSTR